jgi:tetratricopeptide (TPR) repeat protein
MRDGRAEKLADKGYALINDGEFDKALAVADELRALRYTAEFEIAALAYAGKGELDRAVATLEEGVSLAPDVWLNWQLLGNYRSDLGRYAEAAEAYDRALECTEVDRSSVRLNQAVLANRVGEHARTLSLLDDVDDPSLADRAASVRVGALFEMGRLNEAEQLANDALGRVTGSAESCDSVIFACLTADLAQIRLQRGADREQVRAFAVDALHQALADKRLLRLIREIDDERSSAAQLFRMVVHVGAADESSWPDDTQGFYATYGVIADTGDEALGFIRSIVEPNMAARMTVEDADVLEPAPGELKGVVFASGRMYYSE